MSENDENDENDVLEGLVNEVIPDEDYVDEPNGEIEKVDEKLVEVEDGVSNVEPMEDEKLTLADEISREYEAIRDDNAEEVSGKRKRRQTKRIERGAPPPKRRRRGESEETKKKSESTRERFRKNHLELEQRIMERMSNMDQSDDVQQRILNLSRPDDEEPFYIPQKLFNILKPHQIEGLRATWKNIVDTKPGEKGMILSHTMGLGKTLTALSFISLFIQYLKMQMILGKQEKKPIKILLAVPSNVLFQWKDEFEKWWREAELVDNVKMLMLLKKVTRWNRLTQFINEEDHCILLVSQSILPRCLLYIKVSDAEKEDLLRNLVRSQQAFLETPDLVILDEVNLMKKEKTLFKALSACKTENRLVLTGTPFQNHINSLYVLAKFVKPTYWSQAFFSSYFTKPIMLGLSKDADPGLRFVAIQRFTVLTNEFKQFSHRKDATYLMDELPPKKEYTIYVEPSEIQRSMMDAFLAFLGVSTEEILIRRNGTEKIKDFGGFLRIYSLLHKIINHPDCLFNYFDRKAKDPDTEWIGLRPRALGQRDSESLPQDVLDTIDEQQQQEGRRSDTLQSQLYPVYDFSQSNLLDEDLLGSSTPPRSTRCHAPNSVEKPSLTESMSIPSQVVSLVSDNDEEEVPVKLETIVKVEAGNHVVILDSDDEEMMDRPVKKEIKEENLDMQESSEGTFGIKVETNVKTEVKEEVKTEVKEEVKTEVKEEVNHMNERRIQTNNESRPEVNLSEDEEEDEEDSHPGFHFPGDHVQRYLWALPVLQDGYQLGLLERSPKFLILEKLLIEASKRKYKAVVFSKFTTTLDVVELMLKKKEINGEHYRPGIHYYRIQGSVSSEKRNKYATDFNSGVDNSMLMLVSTKAGGIGLNLTGANVAIILDETFDPMINTQAVSRIYRIGQQKPCHIYRVLGKNTIEDSIMIRGLSKSTVHNRVIEDQAHAPVVKNSHVLEIRYSNPEPIENRSLWNNNAYRQDELLRSIVDSDVSVESAIQDIYMHHSQFIEDETQRLSPEQEQALLQKYHQDRASFVEENLDDRTYIEREINQTWPIVNESNFEEVSRNTYRIFGELGESTLKEMYPQFCSDGVFPPAYPPLAQAQGNIFQMMYGMPSTT